MDTLVDELRKLISDVNAHPVGSFQWTVDELKRHGVWRAKIITIGSDEFAEYKDLLGCVVVELPRTSWCKIDLIKNSIIPAGCFVYFIAMDNPLKTKKYTYTKELSGARLKLILDSILNKD